MFLRPQVFFSLIIIRSSVNSVLLKYQILSRLRNRLSTKSDGDTYAVRSKFYVCFTACQHDVDLAKDICIAKGKTIVPLSLILIAGFLPDMYAYLTCEIVRSRNDSLDATSIGIYSNYKVHVIHRQYRREIICCEIIVVFFFTSSAVWRVCVNLFKNLT